MNCDRFRYRYNRWLDERKRSPLDADSFHHIRICGRCGVYARAMLDIDAGLHDIPDVPVPEEILAPVQDSDRRAAGRSSIDTFLFRDEALVALIAITAWIISLILPAAWQSATQVLLVTAAACRFAVTSLRPRLIA
jgi:hypothetical protein